MKSAYWVQYGFSFSHLTEIKIFTLYKDAVKFFESLDREMYKSAFVFKQEYTKPVNELHHFACDKVEYKKHYTEIKDNTRILGLMSAGIKFNN